MSSTKKIDPEISQIYENAHQRLKQKKRFISHLVVFIAGSCVFIILNVLIGYRTDIKPLGYDWFVTAILLWLFVIIIHGINVFLVNKLMGKEWEERQMNRLVKKQLKKLQELQNKIDKKHPIAAKPDHTKEENS